MRQNPTLHHKETAINGYKQTDVGLLPSDWNVVSFDRALQKVNTKRNQIQTSDYSPAGSYPVVDQGKDLIAAFTDRREKSFHVPADGVIVFGDHTCIVKYVDFDFVVGADGTQILTSKGENLTRFQAYELQHRAVKSTGYNRHYKFLKERAFVQPPIGEQCAIARILSDADAFLEALELLVAKKRDIRQGTMQQLLAPKSGWIEQRLGETSQLKARIGWQGLTTAEYLDSGDYQLVTGTDFRGGFIDWDNCHFVDQSRYDQDKYIQLREDDVLVTKDGTIGKVAFIDTLPMPATLNSGVFVIRPKNKAYRPKFLYYLLLSNVFERFLAKLSAGSTISHLYQKDFVGFTFHLPPSDREQDEIASALLDMDIEIQALDAKLTKARQIKHGMMQELLTGRVRLV